MASAGSGSANAQVDLSNCLRANWPSRGHKHVRTGSPLALEPSQAAVGLTCLLSLVGREDKCEIRRSSVEVL